MENELIRLQESVNERGHVPGSRASGSPDSATTGERPDFMVTLGLGPPYTVEDVQKAYRARSLESHPDRGGSAIEFQKVQDAYDRALEYVRFQEGRRQWLAAQVEPYLQQQEMIAEIGRRGGEVDIEKVDWMERSFGDFATLAERLRGIRFRSQTAGDEFIKYLAQHHKSLRYLVELDLSGCQVSDIGLVELRVLRGLRWLNLAHTAITRKGLSVLGTLPEMEWVNIAGTSLGWWSRWRLRRRYPEVNIVTRDWA